ncbi:MAG: diaminopimelate decarboxylase, partial [Actinomycetota bacterium]|nr:diaminopimelate decarboxylase [Actinomycetota bacterium]
MRIDPDVVADLRAGSDGPVCAYVYDLAGLRDHAAAAVAALPDRAELFYAVKANSERPILDA